MKHPNIGPGHEFYFLARSTLGGMCSELNAFRSIDFCRASSA